MSRYFLSLQYLGTAYCGWQSQPKQPSVQQTVENALTKLLGCPTAIVGAGRTDTGVHASYYVAHFDSEKNIEDHSDDFIYHLNCILPHDISVLGIRRVSDDAHARFDAISRRYDYYITLKKNPFVRQTTMHFSGELNIETMNQAAKLLLTTSDFTSFCKLHSDNKTNVCDVTYAHWQLRDDNILVFTIEANRFLRNMVRAVVGTLLEVGRGKMTIEQFAEIIEKKDRCAASSSAQPQGLFLSGIKYPY